KKRSSDPTTPKSPDNSTTSPSRSQNIAPTKPAPSNNKPYRSSNTHSPPPTPSTSSARPTSTRPRRLGRQPGFRRNRRGQRATDNSSLHDEERPSRPRRLLGGRPPRSAPATMLRINACQTDGTSPEMLSDPERRPRRRQRRMTDHREAGAACKKQLDRRNH